MGGGGQREGEVTRGPGGGRGGDGRRKMDGGRDDDGFGMRREKNHALVISPYVHVD